MTLRYVDDLETFDPRKKCCVVEEDSDYPGQLVFQAMDQKNFTRQNMDFLTRFNVLRDVSLWGRFFDRLDSESWDVMVLPSAVKVLDRYAELSQDLSIEGFEIPGGDLHPYQKYGLRQALSGVTAHQGTSFFFFNWGTGSGKGTASVAATRELFNRGQIDLALIFTVRNMKTNLTREFERLTDLNVKQFDGQKATRKKQYAERDFQALVMNYEKMHWDFDELHELVRGRITLFIFDEVQKILTVNPQTRKPNLARQGANKLMKAAWKSVVFPMSASVIKQSPERYWRVFDLMDTNPLGTLTQFKHRYIERTSRPYFQTVGAGKKKYISPVQVWDFDKLEEIPHRIAPWTHSVRKDDPGVRELFKNTDFISRPVEMSPADRYLYNFVSDLDSTSFPELEEMTALQQVTCLQYICNTSEALLHTENELAQLVVAGGLADFTFSTDVSAKMEALLDLIEEIRGQGDQCIVFTHWTNLSLLPISRKLTQHKIKHVTHYGGQSGRANQAAQDVFKADPDITVFLSSDAGSHGLSFQNARYVINYECPYNYDDLMQRNSRIDRADSYLDGLTMYMLYCEDSVEERIWSVNNYRRRMAAAAQGTTESLSRSLAEEKYSEEQLERGSMSFILGRQ